MITIPTVFVLGAGASKPYGFPLGLELRDQVVGHLGSGSKLVMLTQLGFKETELRDFGNRLSQSSLASVDAFLELNPSLCDMGKHAIAMALLPYENQGALFDKDRRSENWYEYLYQKMSASRGEFGQNKVSFVTYNYDRSLEQFFFTALKNSYGLSDDGTSLEMSRVPIVHLHGVLGNLPWQGGDSLPYGPIPMHHEHVRLAARLIRIVSEDVGVASDERFAQAHKLLAEARRIIFLGFGYHPLNLKRLNLNQVLGFVQEPGSGAMFTREILGTRLGMTDIEAVPVKKAFAHPKLGPQIGLAPENYGALAFLRHSVDLAI